MASADDDDLQQFHEEMVPVLMEGWLQKRKTKGVKLAFTGLTSGWQKRYFVVCNRTKKIKYGREPEKLDEKSIPWSNLQKITQEEKQHGKMCRFEIHLFETEGDANSGRCFILEADSPRECDAWVECLSRLSVQSIKARGALKAATAQARAAAAVEKPVSAVAAPAPSRFLQRAVSEKAKSETEMVTPKDEKCESSGRMPSPHSPQRRCA